MAITLKSAAEISIMREGGRILSQVMEKIKEKVAPGMTTLELDTYADRLISEFGEPCFKHVRDYKWATCLCVNEVVVHGIPNSHKLKAGDVLGIDIGMLYKGFNTDMSWSMIVGDVVQDDKTRFLKVGEDALYKAIDQARVGNHVGDISKAIQDTVEAGGYAPVHSLVGHGIGKNLHEDPHIPGILEGKIANTPLLQKGMTIAIEVIYNQGDPALAYKNKDGWTIQSADNSLSGLFEKTVAINESGPEILT